MTLFGNGEAFDRDNAAFAQALRALSRPARVAPPKRPRVSSPLEWKLSLAAAVTAIAEGQVSPGILVERSLAKARDWQPRINCFIEIEEQAARAMSQAAPNGPLRGIPVAHKDMFRRDGHLVSCGSGSQNAFKAYGNATLIERLQAAGVVEVGRLNMAEFAMGPTGHNEHHGATRNPWNLGHITGGSSSGSAGAVAAGIVYAALGSDTGGSIRVPASCCGITGLKPTYSRLSRFGAMHLSASLDTLGPLARSAADIALVMDQIDGLDASDPTCWSPPGRIGDAIGGAVDGLRIGIPEAYFWEGLHPDVEAPLRRALDIFAQLGAVLLPVQTPSMDTINAGCLSIAGYESSARHREGLDANPSGYGAQTRTRLLRGLAVGEEEYARSRAIRPQAAWDFVTLAFAAVDILITPVMRRPVPSLAETDVGGGAVIAEILADLSYETRGFSYLGLPNLVFPVGRAGGLPVGMQLVGRPHSDRDLVALADAYQQVTEWHRMAPKD